MTHRSEDDEGLARRGVGDGESTTTFLSAFLDRSGARRGAGAGAEAISGPPAVQPIGRIHRFELIRRLPSSRQAEVYLARDVDLHRDVILKIAPQRAGMEEGCLACALIHSEGRVLASLDLPGVVRVHEIDEWEGRPYLAIEKIDGQTLEAIADARDLPPRTAAAIAGDLARTADAIHRAGYVHQDLKPANVIVKPWRTAGDNGQPFDGAVADVLRSFGKPIVIDFAIARRSAGRGEGIFDDDRGAGTLLYMAPEQARSEPGRRLELCDVFSLGAVLYRLLAGRPPYRAFEDASTRAMLDLLAGSRSERWSKLWAEQLAAVQRGEIDRKSLEDAKVPAPLKDLCLRALAPEPASRIPSAAALAGEVDRLLARDIWR